jgi:uncharacterized membrane protein
MGGLLLEVLRILVGTVCGVAAAAFFVTGVRTFLNPGPYEHRRQLALTVKRYNRGEITSEELERLCPPGSIRYGLAYTTRPPHRLIHTAYLNGTY